MKVEQIYTNCLSQGAYYIESNGEAAVIDPLREVGAYIEMASERGAKIKYVFETHFHADFVSGHLSLAKQTGSQIVFGPTAKTDFKSIIAEDNQVFEIGDIKIKVLHTPGHTLESSCYLLSDEKGSFLNALHHLVLPSIVLGTIPLAVIARQTRSAMLEVLSEDYVRTARAKGLSTYRVVAIHALRNAMITVVTVIGLQVSLLLAGAILTETIFGWPGIGKWIIFSVFSRDYFAVQGGLLLIATSIMIVNLIVDLLYGFINPRILHQKSKS